METKVKSERAAEPQAVVYVHAVPDCGMVFATLAAAERLLVLGEPVGARLVVSCNQRLFGTSQIH